MIQWIERQSDGRLAAIFLICAPVLLVALVWGYFILRDYFDEAPERMDYLYNRGYDDGEGVADAAQSWGTDQQGQVATCRELATVALDEGWAETRDEWSSYQDGCVDAVTDNPRNS